ncbi:MAG: hypothetical protein HRU20_01640 [Pseudomonadales bacterium]|nr:hypothetical protein [Pseudomonadales bacterium]
MEHETYYMSDARFEATLRHIMETKTEIKDIEIEVIDDSHYYQEIVTPEQDIHFYVQ